MVEEMGDPINRSCSDRIRIFCCKNINVTVRAFAIAAIFTSCIATILLVEGSLHNDMRLVGGAVCLYATPCIAAILLTIFFCRPFWPGMLQRERVALIRPGD